MFSGGGLRFRYPAQWSAETYQVTSTFSSSVVFLSNQAMHSPCVTQHNSANTLVICSLPTGRLKRRSILAYWEENADPAWGFRLAMGASVVIGERRAKLQTTSNDCGIGAQVSVDAVVVIPGMSDSWYEFFACIRGPGASTLERQARDLLGSVRFSN